MLNFTDNNDNNLLLSFVNHFQFALSLVYLYVIHWNLTDHEIYSVIVYSSPITIDLIHLVYLLDSIQICWAMMVNVQSSHFHVYDIHLLIDHMNVEGLKARITVNKIGQMLLVLKFIVESNQNSGCTLNSSWITMYMFPCCLMHFYVCVCAKKEEVNKFSIHNLT